jgi:LysR family glycine cleavage system transcriptional activator
LKNLNFNSLRIFVVAARYENFQRAGSELSLSQGAVSQRIKQLESELHLSLFDRNQRGVTLTPEGRKLARTTESCFDLIETSVREIRQGKDEIVVHISPTFARKWLTPRLPELQRHFPQLQLSIEASSEVLKRPLRKNEIALRHGQSFPNIHGEEMQPIKELKLVAVCSPALPGISETPGLDDVMSLPLIQDTHRRWNKLMPQGPLADFSGMVNFNSAALAIDAAINAQGTAIVPLLFAQDDIDAGRLIEVWRDDTSSQEYIYLVWPEQPNRSTPIMVLVHWLQKAISQKSTVPC